MTILEAPFGVYHGGVEIGDRNGHVCTAENPVIAQQIVAALSGRDAAMVALRDFKVLCRTDISIAAGDALKRIEKALTAVGPLSDTHRPEGDR